VTLAIMLAFAVNLTGIARRLTKFFLYYYLNLLVFNFCAPLVCAGSTGPWAEYCWLRRVLYFFVGYFVKLIFQNVIRRGAEIESCLSLLRS